MTLDLVLANARIAGGDGAPTDIGIADGAIAIMQRDISAPCARDDVGGRLVVPGFIETHIHLDKSDLLDVCTVHLGGLREAVEQVAIAKRGFTEDDVEARASRTLEKAISGGDDAHADPCGG